MIGMGKGLMGLAPHGGFGLIPPPRWGQSHPVSSPPGLPQATKNLLHKAHTRRRKAHKKSRSLSQFCFGFCLGFSFGLIWHKVSVTREKLPGE